MLLFLTSFIVIQVRLSLVLKDSCASVYDNLNIIQVNTALPYIFIVHKVAESLLWSWTCFSDLGLAFFGVDLQLGGLVNVTGCTPRLVHTSCVHSTSPSASLPHSSFSYASADHQYPCCTNCWSSVLLSIT